MDRAVTEKEATASCSNAFESKYLHRSADLPERWQQCEVLSWPPDMTLPRVMKRDGRS